MSRNSIDMGLMFCFFLRYGNSYAVDGSEDNELCDKMSRDTGLGNTLNNDNENPDDDIDELDLFPEEDEDND